VTTLACLSFSGSRVPLPVLEAVSFTPDELHPALLDLRERTGADQLCVLSTCERTELYACWSGPADPSALVGALAGSRRLDTGQVDEAATVLSGPDAVRHLLRVAAGLESFVLGERDIVRQVRTAAEASRKAGLGGLYLERLMASAVNTARRVHRGTRLSEDGRSVAAAAVRRAAEELGGSLEGRRVLVVGAGQVATEATVTAAHLGAAVTVCNRTARHAAKLAASGATVVDLGALVDVLAVTDVAVFGTAAPYRLLDAASLAGRRTGTEQDLLIVDLCLPRNVDPAVRTVAGVRLIDLDDMRLVGDPGSEGVTEDFVRANEIVDGELARYLRWLAGRSAAGAVRRLRADVDSWATSQARQASLGYPDQVRPAIEEGVRRAVRRFAHAPTKRLLEAAEAGDERLVEVLAGVFAADPTGAAQMSSRSSSRATTGQAPSDQFEMTV